MTGKKTQVYQTIFILFYILKSTLPHSPYLVMVALHRWRVTHTGRYLASSRIKVRPGIGVIVRGSERETHYATLYIG